MIRFDLFTEIGRKAKPVEITRMTRSYVYCKYAVIGLVNWTYSSDNVIHFSVLMTLDV